MSVIGAYGSSRAPVTLLLFGFRRLRRSLLLKVAGSTPVAGLLLDERIERDRPLRLCAECSQELVEVQCEPDALRAGFQQLPSRKSSCCTPAVIFIVVRSGRCPD